MLRFYRAVTRMGAPLARLHLRNRANRGKEDAERLDERLGHPSISRPSGILVWLHAASVGESISVLPLVKRLLEDQDMSVLVTSGTVGSAALMADRLPPRAFHQYAPIDLPDAVQRFLDHWRPGLAVLVESELWPNLISETKARGIPLAIVQGRLSERSWRRWRRSRGTVEALLSGFAVVLAQTERDAERFVTLGAKAVRVSGTLKYDAAPLPFDASALAAIKGMIGGRAVWLAASTHDGEEKAAIDAHIGLRSELTDLLSLIAPRHPERADDVAALIAQHGLTLGRRSKGEPISRQTDVYLVDTLGELGLFYRSSPVAFVGGSLVDVGGHNLVEPILSGCAVLCGPHLSNITGVVEDLTGNQALPVVADAYQLAHEIGTLLRDARARADLAERQAVTVKANTDVIENVASALAPFLPRRDAA